jgi:hypothetical protein
MTGIELSSSLRLILSLEYFSMYISEEDAMLYIDWKKQPAKEELVQGFTLIVGQLIAYNIKFWLGNFNQIHRIEEAEQQWYAEKLVVDLRFTKLQKVARVISGNYDSYQTAVNLMNLANNNPVIKNKIEHQVFMSIPSALAWFGITRMQRS